MGTDATADHRAQMGVTWGSSAREETSGGVVVVEGTKADRRGVPSQEWRRGTSDEGRTVGLVG